MKWCADFYSFRDLFEQWFGLTRAVSGWIGDLKTYTSVNQCEYIRYWSTYKKNYKMQSKGERKTIQIMQVLTDYANELDDVFSMEKENAIDATSIIWKVNKKLLDKLRELNIRAQAGYYDYTEAVVISMVMDDPEPLLASMMASKSPDIERLRRREVLDYIKQNPNYRKFLQRIPSRIRFLSDILKELPNVSSLVHVNELLYSLINKLEFMERILSDSYASSWNPKQDLPANA